MSRAARILISAAVVMAATATLSPRAATSLPAARTLLGDGFPIEVRNASHVGLLHWLDSLTAANAKGMTAGKTIEAYRSQYNRRFGPPTREARRLLQAYVEARTAAATGDAAPDAVTRAFLEAGTLGEALDALPALTDPGTAAGLRDALLAFAPRYETLWDGGQVGRAFLQRIGQDPRRPSVAGFLTKLAAFYGVPAVHDPPPRLHVVPVIDGYGTHAQAIGRHLLIEVRAWDGLSDQLAPLVHETAHFLFERLPPDRIEALRQAATALDLGAVAWDALREALPTAIAQGVAGRRFEVDGWSVEQRWYHLEATDGYAKRLYPLVRRTLEEGGSFDEAFVRQAVRLY